MNIDGFKTYYKEVSLKLNDKINSFNTSFIIDENPIIKENKEYFSNLNKDGKLIRGMLVILGYNLLKNDIDYSLDLALAYEVFQTSILIHDDIIDNDDTRRGKPTIHSLNRKKYSNHISNSVALCMGDLGLYNSNKIISTSYNSDPNLGKVLTYFNDVVINTIKGELLDVVTPYLDSTKEIESNIIDIYKLKTAYYTIIGPLNAGLILAGATDEMLSSIAKIGEKIGIAFQIQDDILGIYSDNTGKVLGSDIKEKKQTILYSHILNTNYIDELNKYYGKSNITKNDVLKVRDIFKKSGSYDYAYNLMNKLYDESTIEISNLKWIPSNKLNILIGFIEYLRSRNK